VRTRYVKYIADDFLDEGLEERFQYECDRRDIVNAWRDIKFIVFGCGITACVNLVLYINYLFFTPYGGISRGWNFQPIAGIVIAACWVVLCSLSLIVTYYTVERVL
jgi:hypothetical protein